MAKLSLQSGFIIATNYFPFIFDKLGTSSGFDKSYRLKIENKEWKKIERSQRDIIGVIFFVKVRVGYIERR